MNASNAAQFLPIVQAMAEGKTIQTYFCDQWMDTNNCDFDFEPGHYRIKPWPREIWVTFYQHLGGAGYVHDTEASAVAARGSGGKIIHFIEVI